MTVGLKLATKIEDNEIYIAKDLEIAEDTSNREVINTIQELRHIIRFMEDNLYEQWEENNGTN